MDGVAVIERRRDEILYGLRLNIFKTETSKVRPSRDESTSRAFPRSLVTERLVHNFRIDNVLEDGSVVNPRGNAP